jgi:DNA-binding FadR family transcriptional regulator
VNHSSTRGIHGQVLDLLGRQIMAGELPPGSQLEPERLMDEHGVSRTVVREVLRVLTAKGLVDARPRRGTFVTERSTWNLLDADVMRWRSTDHADPNLVLELGDVREIIEPAAARLAAERRTGMQLAAVATAMARLDAAATGDAVAHAKADLDFHRAVLEAAGNELLVRFAVILEPALLARDHLAFTHAADSGFLEQHRAVLDAIAEQEPERAHQAMADLMATAKTDIQRILHPPRRKR